MTQAPLPFDREERNIQQRFLDFHEAHPEVLEYLLRLVAQVKAAGFDKYAIRPLWERARWHFYFERRLPREEFKMNDHYHSRYARLIMKEHQELDGFFETRELRAS